MVKTAVGHGLERSAIVSRAILYPIRQGELTDTGQGLSGEKLADCLGGHGALL